MVARVGLAAAEERLAKAMGVVPAGDKEGAARALAGHAAGVLDAAENLIGERPEGQAGADDYWDTVATGRALRAAAVGPSPASAPGPAAVAAMLRWRAQSLAEEGDVTSTVASAAVRDLAKSWDTYDGSVNVAAAPEMLREVAAALDELADEFQRRLAGTR